MKNFYPHEITKELKEILGMVPMEFVDLARLYRDSEAAEIPKKIELEQAFFKHKFILLALEHGENWRQKFGEEIKPLIEKVEKKGGIA